MASPAAQGLETHGERDAGNFDAMSRNEVSGQVAGTVVQAGSVTGGVHVSMARRLPGIPAQLPMPPKRFVGRDEDFRKLDQGGTNGHAVLVCGMSGIGKTSLVLHWAHLRKEQFPDGQLYVDLRGADPKEQRPAIATVLRRFLEALGEPDELIPTDVDDLTARYCTLLTGRRVLIVADNAIDPEQLRPLLPGSSSATLVATSRKHMDSLRLREVALLPLEPMPRGEAAELLEAWLPQDRLTAEPNAVAEIIDHCAGLPLALSIVAGRAADHQAFALRSLSGELRDEADRLSALSTSDGEIQVRTALATSVRALDDDAKKLFGRLGVVPGPDFGLAAAASLVALPSTAVAPLLDRLEAMHLVQQVAYRRYRLHDLVRLYARESAESRDDGALHRLTDYYLHAALGGDRLLAPHKRQIVFGVAERQPLDGTPVLEWFNTEHRNLLAIQHEASRRGWFDPAWALAWVLTDYQRWQGHLHDYLSTWLIGLNAAQRMADPQRLAWAHRQLGQAYSRLSRFDDAERHLCQAQQLARQVDDVLCEAATLRTLARTSARRGQRQQAAGHAARALALYRSLDNTIWTAIALTTAAWSRAEIGDHEEARRMCEEALGLHRKHDNRYGVAESADCLGHISNESGNHKQAVHHHQAAVELFQELGNTYKEADATARLGKAYVALNPRRAWSAWQRAHDLYTAQHRSADAEIISHHLRSEFFGVTPTTVAAAPD